MRSLGQCCSCFYHGNNGKHSSCGEKQNTVPQLLSRIKGPWALIYWQNSSRTLWFGRDAFGRRSLLVHWPTGEDCRLLLSSVCPPSSLHDNSGTGEPNFWEELPCGIYSLSVGASEINKCSVGEVQKHEWTDSNLRELIRWERTSVLPTPDDLLASHKKVACEHQGYNERLVAASSQKVLIALKQSIKRRSALDTIYEGHSLQEGRAPMAVLFSGGLDSMILAALLDQCIDTKYEIDLLNVSFDGLQAPDRISARAGLKELERIAPLRRWRLVEIDADLMNLTSEIKHVMSLINPAKTYMDLNIGIALWLAAGGDGWLYQQTVDDNKRDCQHMKYKSAARILLVGSGADEQCAGYGRHRTKYRQGSWLGLNEEMKVDMHRIWKRNLGRDDRCIADHGKEARFPFLDEDVISTLLDIPLWEIADLDQPSGVGDKKILREVARILGLCEAAILPKRAIQFGSRIARESNKKNFGSNRAANQASAGSVTIYGPSNEN